MSTILVETENTSQGILGESSSDDPTSTREKIPESKQQPGSTSVDPTIRHHPPRRSIIGPTEPQPPPPCPPNRRGTLPDPVRRSSEWETRSTTGQHDATPSRGRRRQSLWTRQLSRASSQFRANDVNNVGPTQRWPVENTYRLGPPIDGQRFDRSEAERVVEAVLGSYLDGERYQADRCRQMAMQLSDVIRSRMLQMMLMTMKSSGRYRLVVMVSMAEKAEQGYQVASRCLWDARTDRWVSVTHQNPSLAATVTVYAVYLE